MEIRLNVTDTDYYLSIELISNDEIQIGQIVNDEEKYTTVSLNELEKAIKFLKQNG